jgi:hypothetical protein
VSPIAEAESAIRQLQARYTDAVWRQDCDAFADCFAEDGQWRISGMVLVGRPQIRDTIARILGRFRRVLISFGTPIVALGDGGVSARTYITEQCAWKDGNTNISIGRYYERFVAQGEHWRFSWRLFELHYRGPPDLSGTYFDCPDLGPPPAMPASDALTADVATVRWGLTPSAHE